MREQEYRAAQRREERQHELTMMKMLLAATQNRAVNTIPTAFQRSNYPIVPGSNAENMQYIGASTYTNSGSARARARGAPWLRKYW